MKNKVFLFGPLCVTSIFVKFKMDNRKKRKFYFSMTSTNIQKYNIRSLVISNTKSFYKGITKNNCFMRDSEYFYRTNSRRLSIR